jgi:hypothetical protein
MAGRVLAWPCPCGRWLPVWLPAISLAALMFNAHGPGSTRSPVGDLSDWARPSAAARPTRLVKAGTRSDCRGPRIGLELRHPLN